MLIRLSSVFFSISFLAFGAPSVFDTASSLQQRGKPREARDVLRAAIADFRKSADQPDEAKALSAASQISLALGDYVAAITDAQSAAALRSAFKDDAGKREDLNTIGLANLYSGRYAEALSSYQQALSIDLAIGSMEGEIARENNIGNVYYFQGRYTEALRTYEIAMKRVEATAGEKWNPRRRQLTIANLATLYQRLGKEQIALDLYRQIFASPQAMPVTEQAQLLLNQGVLYRRLGDPIKALELYRAAQETFRQQHHRDGEIGALRNIGTALALDLNDLAGALKAFDAALELASDSSNARGIAFARLYRGEVRRRMHRPKEAEANARAALDAAVPAGLIEEQWMAQLALGKALEDEGQRGAAREAYAAAITIIESVRSGLGVPMRSEFLADKRDAYDSMIALRLADSETRVEELYQWIERSRARTLLDRVQGTEMQREFSLDGVQARLGADAVLLDYWTGSGSNVVLWITNASAGVLRPPAASGEAITQLVSALQRGDENWQGLSQAIGKQLLSGVPLRRHVYIVPDGSLSVVPFEVLTDPESKRLMIENRVVNYLPSAQFLANTRSEWRAWLLPWSRQLVALGDPPVTAGGAFAAVETWQPLPASADEVRGIASLLPGRSEVHLGADASKSRLLNSGVAGVPLLHFSTHAMVDGGNPDRSRILLAGESANTPIDYLFESEVYDLNLRGVDLATISACDTARGQFVSGEGVEAFSNAFLAAGSAATITSLWSIPDAATSDFMQQFYYYLARGMPKSEALTMAKLQFLHSNNALANPRYWAAFVLNGDGWNPTRRVISWRVLIVAATILSALTVTASRRARRIQREPKAEPALQGTA